MTTTVSASPLVGVGVVIRRGEELLLIKRAKDPNRGLWAVPGGKVRRGEAIRETGRREVFEETGLEVEVGDVVWVGEIISDDTHIVLIDLDGVVTGGRLEAGDDAQDAAWVHRDRLGDYELTPTMAELIEAVWR
ncbi:MAG: NUDIX domain-containing protein [Acidimicrobiia bacterium]|nr:NUDIX domain-containing protein [Acidimicrobiia bacterium]